MPSCNTYHLTWGISSLLLQQSIAAVPYLGRGYLLTATVSELQRGIAPLGPPVLRSHHSSGCSSRPLTLASGVGVSSKLLPLASGSGWLLKVTAPGLGHRVAPLGRACAVAAWHSRPLPLTSDVG